MSPNSVRDPPNSQEFLSPPNNHSSESSMHTPPNFQEVEEHEPFDFMPNSLQYFYPKPL